MPSFISSVGLAFLLALRTGAKNPIEEWSEEEKEIDEPAVRRGLEMN